jgi:uncharacterized protein
MAGRLLWGLVLLIALIAAAYAGGGWYFANEIHARALDGAERRASLAVDPDVRIVSIGEETVTLAPIDDDPPPELETPGLWGLRWANGSGQLGDIVGEAGAEIERSFSILQGDPPGPGTPAEIDARAFPDARTAGVQVRQVFVRGPLGRYPAWFEPGDRKTWVVLVHGNSMSRLDNVRLLPALRNAGYPTLTITYRNDAGAPEDPSGLLRYGLTEWKDLEAAVEYAIGRGSTGVVLMGVSMGGGVIAAFLERSGLAEEVRALVLDAPMLDFSRTIDDNASRERLPGIGTPLPPGLAATAKLIARLRWGIEWSDLDYLEHPGMFSMPILVFHGTQDETVPIATSDEFKRLVPEIQLVRCPGAGHIECWNLDPQAYESKMISFLDDATS